MARRLPCFFKIGGVLGDDQMITRLIRKALNFFNDTARESDNWFLSEMYILKENLSIPCTYRSMPTTIRDTLRLCEMIETDFDIVVAIPRSGMVVGSIISVLFGKPLTTPDVLAEGRVWMSNKVGEVQDITSETRLLLVDDGIQYGSAFENAIFQIRRKYPCIKIKTVVLYAHNGTKNKVDVHLMEIPKNHDNYCDYSIMHCKPKKVAFDLDGVLCRDYCDGYQNAQPYLIPAYEIDCIITARLECDRKVTEQWLEHYGVRYRMLCMRQLWENPLEFKASVLIKEKPLLYVESDRWIAKECNERTGVRCLCLQDGVLYG